jgi:hypothetical protein
MVEAKKKDKSKEDGEPVAEKEVIDVMKNKDIKSILKTKAQIE